MTERVVNEGLTCVNCNRNPVKSKERCNACYLYFLYNHCERPRHLYERVYGRMEKDMPLWCRNCGNTEVISNHRCNLCREFYRNNGKERPRHLWDDDARCKTCRVPLKSLGLRYDGRRNHTAGYCRPCYQYKKNNKRSRPRHLWGIGPAGWCECGFPAVAMVEDNPVCNRHKGDK